MNLKFQIDLEYDLNMVIYMLRGERWEQRAKRMNLPLDIVETVHNAKDSDLQKATDLLRKEVQKTYKELKPYMDSTLESFQNSWDEIIDDFSNLIIEKTHPWFFDEYICNITHYNPGLSNWNGNVIGRWWKENAYLQRRITAHEILLAHYFSIHRNNYRDSGLIDKQIWALAEISSFALTGLDKDVRNFWVWDTRGYYTDHNYPELVELQNALKEPFLNRKSFDEYIEKGIELVKQMYNPQ